MHVSFGRDVCNASLGANHHLEPSYSALTTRHILPHSLESITHLSVLLLKVFILPSQGRAGLT